MEPWRRSQYKHNRELSDSLDSAAYPDWRITALFYAVVHLVDGVSEDSFGTTPNDHKTRSTWVYRLDRTQPVADEYIGLKGLSEEARYKRPYSAMKDRLQHAEKLFETIRSALE